MAKFTVKTARPELIKMLARLYVSDNWETFESIGRRYNLSARMVSDLLFRGIAENILSDKVSDLVFHKVVHQRSTGVMQRTLRWEKAFEARDIYKLKEKEQEKEDKEREREQKREIILQEIELVKFQIANYVDIEYAPSLQELEDRLFHLETKLERL